MRRMASIVVAAAFLVARPSPAEQRDAAPTPQNTSSAAATAASMGPQASDGVAEAFSRLCQVLCDGGDWEACVRLGLCYDRGHGIAQDSGKATDLYQKACNLSVQPACDRLLGKVTAKELLKVWPVPCPDLVWVASHVRNPVHKPAAIQVFQRACDSGLEFGCVQAAAMYQRGDGVPRDDLKAQQLLTQRLSLACARGGENECAWLASAYLEGRGVAQDVEKAVEIYGRSCERGHEYTCRLFGLAYRRGDGVPKDRLKAAQLLERAAEIGQKKCDAGDANSCYWLAEDYLGGRLLPKNKATAMRLFNRAAEIHQKECDDQDRQSCSSLGFMYSVGRGVPRNEVKAAELFQRACDARSSDACHTLGLLYSTGKGVPRNSTTAANLNQQACIRGSEAACHELGFAYLRGRGVAQNAAKAEESFRHACCREHPYKDACEQCGRLAAQASPQASRQERPLPARSQPILERACENGERSACYALGRMYSRGKGVPRDMAKAAALFQQACCRIGPATR